MEPKISMMDTLTIRTAAPFKNLFPIKENLLDEIAADMKQNGYDFAHPIIIWAGHKVTVVDGHTRLAAALKIGLTKVPITLKEFDSEEDALKYAIKSQSHRRNLTDAELYTCIHELDKRNPKGGKENAEASHEASGKSAQKTADLLNISRAKVERLRAVKDHGSEKTKAAVASGKMTINKAYNKTMQDRKARRVQESPVKNTAEIREERVTAMITAITAKVRAQFEHEVQAFPELRYTLQERNSFEDKLTSEIEKLIDCMIPLTDTNELNDEEE